MGTVDAAGGAYRNDSNRQPVVGTCKPLEVRGRRREDDAMMASVKQWAGRCCKAKSAALGNGQRRPGIPLRVIAQPSVRTQQQLRRSSHRPLHRVCGSMVVYGRISEMLQ
jgi:hypothetical protein